MGALASVGVAEFRAVLIAPDRELAGDFCRSLAESRAFQILADFKKYPDAQTLEMRLRQLQPEVILLDVASEPETALALIRQMASASPPAPVIGLDRNPSPGKVLQVLKAGAREFLATPFSAAEQREAVAGLALQRRPVSARSADAGKIVAFASAKPGAGASTLAAQTACALARITGQEVLLADLDLTAGSAGILLARRSEHSFLDVLGCADQAAPHDWRKASPEPGRVAVLTSPDEPAEAPLDPVQFRGALDHFRASYGWTVLDLPVIFHRTSLLALASADKTFLVSTPELPSLHLARRAVRLLGQFGIGLERLEVIVNQAGQRDGIRREELEQILGCPARFFLPEDHGGLHRAVALGKPLEEGGELAEAVARLASRLAGGEKGETRNLDIALEAGPAFAGT